MVHCSMEGMVMSRGATGATFGLVLSVGPVLVAYTFPAAAALHQFGAVVLGALIAMQACRPVAPPVGGSGRPQMKRLGLVTTATAIVALLNIPVEPQMLAWARSGVKRNSDAYRQLDLFREAFQRVRTDYVEEVSVDKLIETALNGMLGSLDPHSSYMNEKKDMQVRTSGGFPSLASTSRSRMAS